MEPPPPPPPGHVGVFPGPSGKVEAASSSAASGWKGKLASAAASLKGKAGGNADEAYKFGDISRSLIATTKDKVGASTAVSRAKNMSPEEKAALKEKGVFALKTAAQVGLLVGGPKMKVASIVGGAALSAHQARQAGAAAASAAPPEPERVTLQAVAAADAGQPMSVTVEGVEFSVIVPAGVQRGQIFYFEAEMPGAPCSVAE